MNRPTEPRPVPTPAPVLAVACPLCGDVQASIQSATLWLTGRYTRILEVAHSCGTSKYLQYDAQANAELIADLIAQGIAILVVDDELDDHMRLCPLPITPLDIANLAHDIEAYGMTANVDYPGAAA